MATQFSSHLDSSNRDIQFAIEQMNDGIWDFDISTQQLTLSRRWKAILGYDDNELPNSMGSVLALVHPDDRDEVMSLATKYVTSNVMRYQMEARFLHKNGHYRWMQTRVVILRDANGNATRLVGIHSDISEYKRLHQQEQKHRIMLEALVDTFGSLSAVLDLDAVLEKILDNVRLVVPFDAALIVLVVKDTGQVVERRGIQDEGVDEVEIDLKSATIYRAALEAQRAIVVSPLSGEQVLELGVRSTTQADFRSCICAPISLSGRVLGFLTLLGSRESYFNNDDVWLMQAFCAQAASAIQNARSFEQAQELAAIRERQRIGRELHDVVSQTLFSVNMIAESIPKLWQRNPEKAVKHILEVRRLTRTALADMRSLLVELRPEMLMQDELGDLLDQLCDAFMQRTQIQVDFDVEGEAPELSQDVQVAFYRIAQESLNNIAKHANADQVDVRLECRPGSLQLVVKDYGRGFAPGKKYDHFGLKIMQERARQIGAMLDIQSKVGVGTEVVLTWYG